MHFAITGEHRHFFSQNGWLICEGLLSGKVQAKLAQSLKAILSNKVQSVPFGLQSMGEQAYSEGRDLWRASDMVKKVVLDRSLAEIMAELIDERSLRLGYDQLIPAFVPQALTNLSLHETTAIQGVVGGVILCIQGADAGGADSGLGELLANAGQAIFFGPHLPLPFERLACHHGAHYLMVVYVNGRAVYRHEGRDTHPYALKQLGYHYGDKLLERLHPTVYP